MNILTVFKRIGFAAGSVGLVMAAYRLWVRPYHLRWGATGEEVQRSMPGDELVSNPNYLATRAITIEGTPEAIWPWLIQMGYKRAGFYGYDLIENLGSPRGFQSAQHIVPELQNPQVGDTVPISPAGGLTFSAIEPNRYLVWRGGTGWGGYTWALYPIDARHTRLVSRARFSYTWSNPVQLALDLITEFAEHPAIPRILQGVKGRVEGFSEPMAKANAEVALYLASALIYLGSAVLAMNSLTTWRRGVATLAAGAGWLVAWYAPVQIWVKAIVELLVLWGLREADHEQP